MDPHSLYQQQLCFLLHDLLLYIYFQLARSTKKEYNAKKKEKTNVHQMYDTNIHKLERSRRVGVHE